MDIEREGNDNIMITLWFLSETTIGWIAMTFGTHTVSNHFFAIVSPCYHLSYFQ